MRFTNILASALAVSGRVALARPQAAQPNDLTQPEDVNLENPTTMEDFQALALKNLEEAEAANPAKRAPGSCSLANARIRRDWYVHHLTSLYLTVPNLVISVCKHACMM